MIKAIGNKIIVKPDKKDEKTRAGVFLPDQVKDRPMVGTIISVGEGKPGEKTPSVKEGERVVFGRMTGEHFEYQDEDYLLLEEHFLLGKVEDEEKNVDKE